MLQKSLIAQKLVTFESTNSNTTNTESNKNNNL